MCKDLGLYHYHTHDSRRSEAGFVDSFIMNLKTGLFLPWEVKSQVGKLTSAQRALGYGFQAGGHPWGVRRPADLMDGSIAAELCALAGLKARA